MVGMWDMIPDTSDAGILWARLGKTRVFGD